MARIRTVKPSFFTDELIGKFTPWTRLAYIGIWGLCDDKWRFRAAPGLLKSQLFPYDDLDIVETVQPLVTTGRVVLYVNDLQLYGYAPNCRDHQRVAAPRPSELPPPPEVGFFMSYEAAIATSEAPALPGIGPKPKKPAREHRIDVGDVLAHLNAATGNSYRSQGCIKARLDEKDKQAGTRRYSTADLKLVIDYLLSQRWWRDKGLVDHTRPFRGDKFEAYLMQARKWAEAGRPIEGTAGATARTRKYEGM